MRRPLARSGQARQVVGELGELRVVDRLQYLGHRRLVAVPGAALVLAQRLQQIVFALPGQARDIFLPGKIRAVADIAMVLLDERAGAECLFPFALPRRCILASAGLPRAPHCLRGQRRRSPVRSSRTRPGGQGRFRAGLLRPRGAPDSVGLNIDAYCPALTKVYAFGPTFCAKNSNTRRHHRLRCGRGRRLVPGVDRQSRQLAAHSRGPWSST